MRTIDILWRVIAIVGSVSLVSKIYLDYFVNNPFQVWYISVFNPYLALILSFSQSNFLIAVLMTILLITFIAVLLYTLRIIKKQGK